MRKLTKNWLEPHSWASILEYWSRLQNRPADFEANTGYEEARVAWEKARGHWLPLDEALQTCRSCSGLKPFGNDDCGSFAHIAKALVEPLTSGWSPMLAATLGAVIEDYVNGASNEDELRRMLEIVRAKLPDSGEFSQGRSLLDR